MRKVILLITTLFILQFVWNCGNKNGQETRTAFHADLDNCKLSADLKLSGLIEDYRLVPLETTNESLLGEFRSIISLSGEFILIADRNNVYKFSGEGRFINKIIKNGRGPAETSGSCRYFFNRNSNILFFEDDFVENENIRCYDVKAEKFLPSIKKCFPGRWLSLIVYQDSLIMASIEGVLRGETNPYAVFVQNFKGQFVWGIKSNKTFIIPRSDINDNVLQRFVIYPGEKSVFLKYWQDDTLFTLMDKDLTAYLIPEYKNKILKPNMMPFEGDIFINYESCQNPAFVLMQYSLFTGWTSEGSFNRAHYNKSYYILNKTNGEHALIQSYQDDFTGTKFKIGKSFDWTPGVDKEIPFPKSSPDGELYVIYYPNELSKIDTELKNSPFKNLFAQLEIINKNQKETDNPVLLIGYPKKRLQLLK
ncbi:MAG: 6-bladed beta-propeller [Bacteroidales bacterium]|jgi:hypothetical protein|nr:6-bladed beta-propeller [Bacteroidales bacterium]